MVKDKTDKVSPKDNYEGFLKQYSSWIQAQNMSKAAVSKDVNDRETARNYALSHAEKNVPGYEQISKDPIVRVNTLSSQATIDNLLQHSEVYNGTLTNNRFKLDGEDIITNTPEKGLAAIALAMPVVKVGESYGKASGAHKGYAELTQILSAEDVDHKQLLGMLIPHLAKRTEEKFSQDKYLGGDKNLMTATINASSFLLASSKELCVNGVVGIRESYKKEFDKELPKDADKAKYAREILRVLSNDDKAREIAMNLVYSAYEQNKKSKR